jgi:TorA maturation chaperone TorD
MIDLQDWIVLSKSRADTYTLLSRIWGIELDESLYRQLRLTVFPELPAFPALDRAYRRLEIALQDDSPGRLTDLAADYARLCLGSDPREGADPYESVHRNKEGLMMQDEWEAVLRLYGELGLARSETTHESEDHLALELECMAQLCARQEAALLAGELGPPGGWSSRRHARNHLPVGACSLRAEKSRPDRFLQFSPPDRCHPDGRSAGDIVRYGSSSPGCRPPAGEPEM